MGPFISMLGFVEYESLLKGIDTKGTVHPRNISILKFFRFLWRIL